MCNAAASRHISQLTPDLAGAARREADRRWLPAVIDPYVARGDIPAAWQLWTHFGGIAPDPRGLLRDGDFSGRFAPPFGWELASKDGGLADIAVQVEFANIRKDPRWLPFLRKIGKAPEQLAAIRFDVTLPR